MACPSPHLRVDLLHSFFFFFSSRRRHTRFDCDWSSDVCSSDLGKVTRLQVEEGETVIIGTMNNPGSLILTISDLGVVEVVVQVDETDVPELALGRSEERRVGKECRSGWRECAEKQRVEEWRV